MSSDNEKYKDIDHIGLLDLFDLDEIQKMQDAFAFSAGVASIITYPDGKPITNPSNFTRVCRDFVRASEKGRHNCYCSDAELGKQNPQGPVYQKCLSAGLWDGGAGISVGNRHIANWLIGQVRSTDFDEDKMATYAKTIGANEHEYRQALREVAVMTEAQFIRICNSLFLFANHLSQMAYQNLQLKIYQNHLEELVQEKTEGLNLAYEELQAINEELSDKNRFIGQQNKTLKTALTTLRKTQTQLLHAEKMAALGVLTAGVAHEINNPLNYIKSAYYGLESFFEKRAPELAGEAAILLNSINEGVNRAANVVQNLYQISRNPNDLNETCDLHAILDQGIALLSKQFNPDIRIIKRYKAENHCVKGNYGQLVQVFVNLLTNAYQSIKEQGSITLSTKLNKASVSIIIADTGIGIKKDHLKKLTDPFFTTKDPGKGTGLGLYVAFKTLQEHKGSMTFKSAFNVGTTVTVKLPVKP